MTTLDRIYEMGAARAKEKAIAQMIETKTIQFVRNLLQTGKCTIAEIAGLANVPEAFVLQVKETMQ